MEDQSDKKDTDEKPVDGASLPPINVTIAEIDPLHKQSFQRPRPPAPAGQPKK